RIKAVETADDEDLAREQCDGRPVRARHREPARGSPDERVGVLRHRSHHDDQRREESESARAGKEPAEPPDHRARRVTLPTPTPCCENQVLPSSTRSNWIVYVPAVAGTSTCAFTRRF